MNNRIVRSAITALAASVLLGGGAISAFAQATTPPATGARVRIVQELGLSASQKKQFMAVMKSHREQKKTIEASTATPEVKKTKLLELDKATKTSMESILTPAQLAKYKELRAENRAASSTTPPTVTAPKS